MKRYASAVIKVLRQEVGYLEKKSNAQLDDKTTNAGYNNYTKYARDLDALGYFYNGPKQGYPYCDVTIDWAFVQAYGVEAAMDLLCQPEKSYGAGCGYSARYYKNKGQWHTKDPKPGDQIFFRNFAHTGLVVDVDSTYVHTIEGNTSTTAGVIANGGGVWEKKYRLGDSCIDGYGRPAYDPEPEDGTEQPEKAELEEAPKVDYDLHMRNLSVGCKGEDVRALQILLIGRGYSCGSSGADADFGSATAEAVRRYQADHNLTADGIAGPKTMACLMGVAT